MNNEIGRKTTSLILMTIMVAGGLTFAIPSMEPVYAQSTPNLYVSAADPNGYGSRFDNTFGGLQIVQVIVNDPLIRDADDAEPRVRVDDKELKMFRHTDGNWYGYFRVAADGGDSNDGLTFADAQALWGSAQPNMPNLIRQAGITIPADNSVLKTFDLDDTFDIVYHKAGAPQTITITYDDSVNNDLTLDRTSYPRNSHVHVEITDHILNIDPTTKDIWRYAVDGGAPAYMYDDRVGSGTGGKTPIMPTNNNLGCKDDKCNFSIDNMNPDTNDLLQLESGTTNYIFEETGPNTGVFTITNDDKSPIMIEDMAPRGQNTQIMYSDETVSVNTQLTTATVNLDIADGTWNSGEVIDLTIVDADQNLNSEVDDDQKITNSDARIPTFMIGEPYTLTKDRPWSPYSIGSDSSTTGGINPCPLIVDNRIDAKTSNVLGTNYMAIHCGQTSQYGFTYDTDHYVANMYINRTGNDLRNPNDGRYGTIMVVLGTVAEHKANMQMGNDFVGVNLLNYDFGSLGGSSYWIVAYNPFQINSQRYHADLASDGRGVFDLASKFIKFNDDTDTKTLSDFDGEYRIAIASEIKKQVDLTDKTYLIVADIFSIGFTDDGAQASERVNNQIIRIEVEETGENTSTFTGTLEYIMINQLNVNNADTYKDITPIGNEVKFIAFEDLTGSDARVNYVDQNANDNTAVVSDQQDIATTSGVVSLNAETYSVGSNVVITLEDSDLNTDPDRADTYTVVMDSNHTDTDRDQVGMNVTNTDDIMYTSLLPGGKSLGMLLEVTFDGKRWQSGCTLSDGVQNGLGATGFTLQETGSSTGVFTGSFSVPKEVCNFNDDGSVNTNEPKITVSGKDIGVTYLDFRDASGQIVTAGDSASIGASTGSVSLDRTVYPVPYGTGTDDGSSGFLDMKNPPEPLPLGTVKVYVQVNDPDYNLNPTGEDKIEGMSGNGPVMVTISRSGDECAIAYAGGTTTDANDAISALKRDLDKKEAEYKAATTDTDKQTAYLLAQLKYDNARSTGGACPEPDPTNYALVETSPESGVFEASFDLSYIDGPSSTDCPNDGNCILQGDIITVQYNDTTDASGNPRTVTDSATFDLRNGALQTDKSVYVIGSDMIVTLIDPDLDLDSGTRETYTLDLIKWDSDAGTKNLSEGIFDAEPGSLRETGPSTGIFQVVISVPKAIDNDRLERGEEIKLEYTDYGPSGADYVGDNTEDIDRTVFTSNFGATIELDQSVYSWTDKVFITVTAPDHNLNTNQVDEIGADPYPVRVATRSDDIKNYKLVETGTNTGIFTGEVILTGFSYDADGDDSTGENGKDVTGRTCDTCNGPTDGLLPTDNDDGLEVSFEFSDDETVRKSALIRWNIGEVQWLEASYPATATGVLRVIDPDMNLNPESADNFEVKVWSSSAPSGITLTVTETQPASGIFEGTVFFGLSVQSGGHKLSTEEGDTVTAKYSDNTLPAPYNTGDSEDITATTIIGTIVPPLERVKIESLRIVDSTGTTLSTVSIDQQVQITADLTNTQDKDQPFAYLVQIQDSDGVTVSLSWIDGSLTPSQSFSPSQSWIPTAAGEYTITVFAWESLTIPTALSPQQTTTITVN